MAIPNIKDVMVESRKKIEKSKLGSMIKGRKGSTKAFDMVLNGVIILGSIAVALILVVVIVAQFQATDVVTDGSYADNASNDMLAVLATVPDWAQIGFIFAIGLALLAGVMALRNMRQN